MFDSHALQLHRAFSLDYSTKWGIADLDWSNSKVQWVQKHPMQSQEELVTAASATNHTRAWV